jgi:serine protease AprX
MKGHGSVREVLGFGLVPMMIGLTASSAFAGEVLRLRNGSFALSDRSASILKQAVREKAADATTERYFVVQFGRAIREADHAALKSAGIEAVRYLPDDALLVRATAEQAGVAKAAVSGVTAVVPYEASWKVALETIGADEPLLVTLARSDEASRVEPAIRHIPGVTLVGRSDTDLVVSARPESVSALSAIEGIEWIDRLPALTTFALPMAAEDASAANIPEWTGFETGTKIMGFESAWQRGFTGRGETTSISDTGVDTGSLSTLHSDLAQTKGGIGIGTGSKSWEDPQGHGTHVAGSIVANGANSRGRIQGGAYESNFYAVGLWSPLLNNLHFPQDFQRIAGTAYSAGARIHSNSWGNSRDLGTYDAFARKTDEYLWSQPEMLMLFAAGNSGEDQNRDGRIDEGSVSSPGTAKNVLTVGASENYLLEGGIQKKLSELRDGSQKWGVEPLASDRLSDNPKGLAAFSSRGPTRDGRLKPEVVAPGTNIVSTRSKHPKAGALWGAYGDHYAYAGGTSMATPLTAGAAAVTRQYIRQELGVSNPSGALVKAVLIHTAFDLFPGQFGGAVREHETPRPNVHEGYGRVDVDAITALAANSTVTDESRGVGTGESRQYQVELPVGGNLRATLVYTDAPGAVSAARALVNNLDLSISGPDGSVQTKNDAVNNTEMLELSNLQPGTYTVTVKGANVPMGRSGKQPYALVITNDRS